MLLGPTNQVLDKTNMLKLYQREVLSKTHYRNLKKKKKKKDSISSTKNNNEKMERVPTKMCYLNPHSKQTVQR
jgi:hypothetical protein